MRLPLLLIAVAIAGLPAVPARAQDTVDICHATGSPQNPYVPLTLDNQGVLEHVNHEDDLVPAPAGGCPTTPVVDPDDTPVATATPPYAVPTPEPTPSPTATPRPPRDDDEGDDGGAKGGDDDGGGGAPTPSAAPQARAAETRHLPMTGSEMWLVAGFGLSFLLCGVGVRLISPAASGRPPGPSGR